MNERSDGMSERSGLRVSEVRTIAELPDLAAGAYGEKPALRFRRDGGWVDRSYTELAATVDALARGLAARGVAAGDRVCLLGETRPEWSYVGLAVVAAGAILVPIYPSSSVEECAWIVRDSGARLVVCDDAAQAAKIGVAAETLVIDDGALDDLVAAGDGVDLGDRRAAIRPGDASLIIYTSGTTGPAKGCVLTHTNWLALCTLIETLGHLRADEVVYLFLPLAHVFAQIVQYGCLYVGGTLVYFGGDVKKIVPELAEVRPTFLPSVPRIFEKIYTLFAGAVPPAQLSRAVQVGLALRRCERAGAPVPAELAEAFAAVDPLFAKVRAVFGGRLRQALTGAAPISVEVLEFFHAAGVPVLEGYGMSETTAVGTVTTLERFKLGTVGFAAPGVTVAIADDGEILMKGPNVFAGYWNNPDATAATVVDGWLHTGDLGAVDEDGFVTITGRKKDIIITAGGKNIAPANLENALRQSRWISHAVMFGDGRPYPVALLTLDPEEILPWAAAEGLPTDPGALAAHPRVAELVQSVVDEVNARQSRVAQIKKYAILSRDLSQEAGELTPTLKIKRKAVAANHAGTLDSLYR
jgi:long-chain acyl-CoA synthetase